MAGKPAEPIRVLLVDDHPVVVEGIRALLGRDPGISIIGTAVNGADGVREAERLQPDVVVMDIHMPILDGLEATRRIRSLGEATQVIVLSGSEKTEYVAEVMRSGARGYLLKDCMTTEIVTAVRVVAGGGVYLSPRAAGALAVDGGADADERERNTAARLSPRERDVLVAIANGATNKEMAKALRIGVRTVETHRQRLMDKLGIRSVAGLTQYAIARGWVAGRVSG